MNQLFMPAALTGALAFLCLGCQLPAPCPEISGQWTNREGQDFIFQPDGTGLWLVKFGSSTDSARFDYRLDCSKKPAALDLVHFQNGPLVGKNLFGIIEWSSDSSFRLRYETGQAPDVRPAAFEQEQTMKFYKGE